MKDTLLRTVSLTSLALILATGAGTPDWRITLGASNLTDRYPERSAQANDFFGNFAYDPINPIGLNGRLVYARTELSF